MMKKFLEKLGLDAESIVKIEEEYNKRQKEADEKIASLTSEIESMKAESSKTELRHAEEISALNKNNAVENALTRAGAITLKAVKALIDTDKIVIDEKGNVTGLSEQIEALQKSSDTKYLFDNDRGFRGVVVGNSDDENISVEDMNYTQLCAYFEGK